MVGECLHAPLRTCLPAALDIRHQSPPPAPIGDDLRPPLPSYSVLSRPPARHRGDGRGGRRTVLHYPPPQSDLAVHPGPPHTAPSAMLSLALCPQPTSPLSFGRCPSPFATGRLSPAPREREPPPLLPPPPPPPLLPLPRRRKAALPRVGADGRSPPTPAGALFSVPPRRG